MAKEAHHSKDWGGRREGAGIKTEGPVRRVTITLPISLLEQIDREAYRGSNRSAVIARYLREALE